MSKLSRKDTVLLDDVLTKSESKEIVDFVYNFSHIWSQRHPERCDEVCSENMEFAGLAKIPVKGKEAFKQRACLIHDSFNDFHYHILAVHHEGDLNKGTITMEFKVSGESMKAFGEMKKGCEGKLEICGAKILRVSEKKVQSMTTFLDVARTTPEALMAVVSIH